MPPEPQPKATDTTGQPSWMAPVMPVVPDHELLRRIGGGSYGDVWLARTTVGTWRAVKVVFRDRFTDARPYEREFNGIQKFEPLSRGNEAFIDILQIGRNDAEGYFYYVMELADDASAECGIQSAESQSPPPGIVPHSYVPKTLSKVLLQRGRLPVSECLELGLTLNLGLAHLHRAGLIHRDIKPSNLIFVGGVPKLADIGLVVETAEARSYVGTEGFIPPEGPNSPQADLFSLGKVLYEAGMGKDRKDFPEPFTQIIDAPDSTQLLEFNAILLKACAANVKERYQSAEEMNADLALLQSGGSVRRQRKLAGQLRFVQRAGALVTALAAVITAGWWWQARQTQHVQRLAEEKSTLAIEKTTLANNLARLGEENRQRILRLDIANGVRLLEEGDPAGALLWFADALPFVTNNAAAESIHRLRLQQTLEQTPRVLRAFPHESGLSSSVFSGDGRFIATGTKDGNVRVWDAAEGSLVWGPKQLGAAVWFVRFTRDGKRLFACSSARQGVFNGGLPPRNFFVVLDAQSGREIFSAPEAVSGMSTNVICSAFSPDDRWLAASHTDHSIRVLDPLNGRQLVALRGHTKEVRFLSFSADGSLLASASLDQTVRLWHLPSGAPADPPFDHRLPVVRAELTDDGRKLISCIFQNPGDDGAAELQVWDVASSRRLGKPVSARDRVGFFAAPEAHGRFFVQHRNESRITAHNLETSDEVTIRPDLGGVLSWNFNHDGSRLVLGNGDHLAQVFDMQSGAPLTGPLRHGRWGVTTVQFSPDERWLLTGCDDGSARLWDLRPRPSESVRQTIQPWLRSGGSIRSIQERGRSAGGIAIEVGERTVSVMSEQLEELRRFTSEEPGTSIIGPLNAPNGRIWAIPHLNASHECVGTMLWSWESGEVRQIYLRHPERSGDCAFAPDSRYLISIHDDRRIRFWRTSDGHLERSLEVTKSRDGMIFDLSPPSNTGLWRDAVLSGDATKYSFQLLDLDSGVMIGEARELPATVFNSVFSPDGKHLALLDEIGPVTVLEARTGRLISSAIRHSSNLKRAQWDLEGRRLLTVGHNDEVLVWDAETGAQVLRPLRTPGRVINGARWSPDGRFIVTISDYKNVRIWDTSTGEMVTPPFQHSNWLAFAFLTPSHRLITASYPDTLRAWDLKETRLAPDVLADYAKMLASRTLDASGTLVSLRPEELAELNRSLRTRAPQLFE